MKLQLGKKYIIKDLVLSSITYVKIIGIYDFQHVIGRMYFKNNNNSLDFLWNNDGSFFSNPGYNLVKEYQEQKEIKETGVSTANTLPSCTHPRKTNCSFNERCPHWVCAMCGADWKGDLL